MVDADLAALYDVPTKVLNQAVNRNAKRFPPDFMYRLNKEETAELVTNCDRLRRLKHSSAMPRVFTEQGVAMLSSVLRSERAIQVNIQIMRAFIPPLQCQVALLSIFFTRTLILNMSSVIKSRALFASRLRMAMRIILCEAMACLSNSTDLKS